MISAGLDRIQDFLAISERLGTGGQPRPSQFADLAAAGYQVVINLAMPDPKKALSDEDWLVVQQGMLYVHMPIPWDAPTLDHVERFLGLMDLFSQDKVFVHCARNMRVSALVYVYRVCRLHTPEPVAATDMYKIWHPHGVWLKLLDIALANAGVEL